MNAALTKPDLEGSCYAPTRLQQIAMHETEQLVIDDNRALPRPFPSAPCPPGAHRLSGCQLDQSVACRWGTEVPGTNICLGFPDSHGRLQLLQLLSLVFDTRLEKVGANGVNGSEA